MAMSQAFALALALALSGAAFPGTSKALHSANFTQIDGSTGASGVWRNDDAGQNLTTAVSLAISGGTVAAAGTTAQSSRVDGSYAWADASASANTYEPNFTGDIIRLQVPANSSASLSISLGSLVLQPVLYLADMPASLSYACAEPLVDTGITTSPTFTWKSVRFTGAHSWLSLTLVNSSTTTAAQVGIAVTAPSAPFTKPRITVAKIGNDERLEWGYPGAVGVIQKRDANGIWQPDYIPSATETGVTLFRNERRAFYRGLYEVQATPASIIAAMQADLAASPPSEMQGKQIVFMQAARPYVFNGAVYQQGQTAFKTDTIFGIKTILARAVIHNGVVIRWEYWASGMEIL